MKTPPEKFKTDGKYYFTYIAKKSLRYRKEEVMKLLIITILLVNISWLLIHLYDTYYADLYSIEHWLFVFPIILTIFLIFILVSDSFKAKDKRD